MLRKFVPALLVALIALTALPAAASAQINVAVGIGDQAEGLFDNENFQKLRVKKVRYFIKWDAIDREGEIGQADAYVNAAQRNNADVLMHISSNNLTRRAAELSTMSEFRDKVGQLI